MIFLATLALIALALLLVAAFLWIQDIRRRRRSAWVRRHVDKRFTSDPRDWRSHFDQYDKPAILRRQAE